jgi:hypothetical protein
MENQQDQMSDQQFTQGQAVNVLIQAARIAQSKGAFTLEDAELVSRAIKVFVPTPQASDEADAIVNQTESATKTEATVQTLNPQHV